jgi:hypothetical protein
MPPLVTWLRRLGFWVGPVLLGGSLLLTYLLLIAAAFSFLSPVLGPVHSVLVWGARQPDTREPKRLTFYQPAFGGK